MPNFRNYFKERYKPALHPRSWFCFTQVNNISGICSMSTQRKPRRIKYQCSSVSKKDLEKIEAKVKKLMESPGVSV